MAEIRVPTLGESVTEATIGKWFKKPGEAVAVDEPLVELETDKVTIEVPAPAAGVLADIAAKDGETVAVGALLGQIKDGAGVATGAGALDRRRRAGARAFAGRRCIARGACEDDAAAPDHRAPPEGCAEHRRHADHLQRGRHEGGDGYAQPL